MLLTIDLLHDIKVKLDRSKESYLLNVNSEIGDKLKLWKRRHLWQIVDATCDSVNSKENYSHGYHESEEEQVLDKDAESLCDHKQISDNELF